MILHHLKNHPFAVKAHFEQSLVLTFAIPKAALENRIPDCLTLDTFQDQWAFIAVALVQTKHLRPKGFPEFMGNNFQLIGYRIFVRYTNKAGKRLRGLYILKSETDKKKMEWLGNIFTHYNYTTTDISRVITQETERIYSTKSDFEIELATTENAVELPQNSPFANWKEARRFAGPLPFTFTYNAEKKRVLIIQGIRQNWTPKPVQVVTAQFSFLEEWHSKGLVLANAFRVENVPYSWQKGKIEVLNQSE